MRDTGGVAASGPLLSRRSAGRMSGVSGKPDVPGQGPRSPFDPKRTRVGRRHDVPNAFRLLGLFSLGGGYCPYLTPSVLS